MNPGMCLPPSSSLPYSEGTVIQLLAEGFPLDGSQGSCEQSVTSARQPQPLLQEQYHLSSSSPQRLAPNPIGFMSRCCAGGADNPLQCVFPKAQAASSHWRGGLGHLLPLLASPQTCAFQPECGRHSPMEADDPRCQRWHEMCQHTIHLLRSLLAFKPSCRNMPRHV